MIVKIINRSAFELPRYEPSTVMCELIERMPIVAIGGGGIV
jgi:hypothetical protein